MCVFQVQESIRGCNVFLIQPTSPPSNDHLMELLIMIDACRRASARTITAVIPYFGYARADRKASGRESIAGSVANSIFNALDKGDDEAKPVLWLDVPFTSKTRGESLDKGGSRPSAGT